MLASKTLTAAVVLVTTLVAVTWASGRTVSPGLAPATGRTGEATAFHVLPGGGYLFDGGHLRVAADGRSIDEIELTTLCTRRVSLRALPIAADGRFGYAGPPAAGGGHAVVSGRFRSSGTATMRLALDVEGCPPRPLTVEARIS